MKTLGRFALFLALVACVVLALSNLWVAAAPPVPSTFYGTVLINSATPSLPVTVEALIGGVAYASVQAETSGSSVVYSIDVPGDIPETTGTVEGGVAGDTVQFRVSGLTCTQTSTWQSGGRTNLDLTATGTLPTNTPTSTPTQTPVASSTPTRTNTPSVTATPITLDMKVSNTNILDTDIDAWNPSQVQPADRRSRLRVRQNVYNSLMRFDVSTHLPTDAAVQSATLYLYLSSYEHLTAQSPVVSIYKVKKTWEPLQATWNQRLTGTNWSGLGCSDSTDRELVATSSTVVSAVSAWYQFDVTALVQEWASGGSAANYGMLLSSDNPRELRFYSADDSDTRYQPYLRVTYNIGSGPTPTATAGDSPTPTKTPSVSPTPVRFEKLGALSDTAISSWYPTTNYGTALLRVRGSGTMSSLLQFDLTGIPEGSIIVSGTLRLTTYEYDDGKTNLSLHIGAYLVNRAWSESTATWNLASTGVSWAAAGCNGVTQDRVGTPAGTTEAQAISGSTGAGVSYIWDVTSIAQSWVDDLDNQAGLLLMAEDVNQREIRFIQSEESRSERWPLLVLQWQAPAPTATPTFTPTITPTPSNTPTPTATETPTLTPTATVTGGTVTGVVYNDNTDGLANSQRDAGESGVAGTLVQLWSGTTFVNEYITIGSGAFTFSNVPAGTYTIIATPPSGYLASPASPNERSISVVTGYTTEVYFGLYDPLLVEPLLPVNLPLVMNAP